MSGFRRFLLYMILPGSLAAGIAFGAVCLYAAFDHNPQGQVCEATEPQTPYDIVLHGRPCAIVWDQVIGIFASCAGVISILGVAVATLLYWCVWVISTLATTAAGRSRQGANTGHA